MPFTHRFRVTSDAFDPANRTLTDLLSPPSPDHPARALFFIDSGVAAAWPGLDQRIRAYAHAHRDRLAMAGLPHTVPGGEACKNDRAAADAALAAIHAARLCRHSYVIAIGGGAVLDTVGFAAAIAHRGVRLVRLPTTTLAQDDSGVGVKNGINLFGQKNYAGVFAAPWAVINDERFLTTLSDRDWRSGFSEAVKVALMKDPAFFARIAADARRIRRRDMGAAAPVLRRSAELHLHHIAQGGDPFELAQARPLDFGHWAAHRLETLTNFRLRHGEAVAIGIALDNAYAVLAGLLDPAPAAAVDSCLTDLGFDLSDEALADIPAILQGLEQFREHLGGQLTISLLRGIGQPVDVHEIDTGLMAKAAARLASRGRAGAA